MKKLWVLLLLGLSFPAGAEIVSTISYNPARMGQYDYLKVSKEAVFKGGLEVSTDLNVNSSGTVEMEWDAANADKIYKVDTVTGEANTSVDMPNTTFRGETALTSNAPEYYATNPTAPDNASITVELNGGSLSAKSKDSYVGTLNGENTYQHYTTNLNANTLNINGKGGNTVGLTQEDGTYGGSTTYGFHLAGVDIPYPTGSFVQKTGTTALSTTSRLCWVPRCTKGGKVALVLSLVNTTSCPASTSNISCTQTTIDSDFVDIDIDLSGCAGPCTRAGTPGHWVKSGTGCCCESDRCGTQEDITGNRYPCYCVFF